MVKQFWFRTYSALKIVIAMVNWPSWFESDVIMLRDGLVELEPGPSSLVDSYVILLLLWIIQRAHDSFMMNGMLDKFIKTLHTKPCFVLPERFN
jgi:hypothetical protein